LRRPLNEIGRPRRDSPREGDGCRPKGNGGATTVEGCWRGYSGEAEDGVTLRWRDPYTTGKRGPCSNIRQRRELKVPLPKGVKVVKQKLAKSSECPGLLWVA